MEITAGCIVQLSPIDTENKAFAGCFLVVTEVYSWGVQGYVQALGENKDTSGGQAYYRAKNGTFELVGVAEWIIGEQESIT